MTNQESVDQYLAEAERERAAARAEGVVYFGRSAAWDEFCKQMVEEILPGKPVDDFDEE